MKKILFTFIISLLSVLSLSAQGKIYAVLVGVSEYEQSDKNLNYCHRDAIAMYELLKKHTSSDKMVLLTDRQAKHDNIIFCTNQLFRQAKPEDIVIFHFSGHGSEIHLASYDKALYYTELQKIFKKCKVKRKLLFVDACHSGALRQPGNQTTSTNINPGKNVLLFLSSRSNQLSSEWSDLKNGIFTYFLLAGLNGGADADKDGYITAKELFNFVNPKVKERSKGEQVPVMWGKFDKNMIILNLKNK